MSKSTSEQLEQDLAKLEKVSGGGNLGGTEFGQAPGEAKVNHPDDGKPRPKPSEK